MEHVDDPIFYFSPHTVLWTIIVVLFILILIVVFVKYDGRPGY